MSELTREVMIVGAGPTGLMLACDLQRRGISSHIVDRSESPSTLSRAVGLQARTLEALGDLGLAQTFLAKGLAVTAVRSYNKGRLHHLFELDACPGPEAPYPYLLVVEQHVTESILLEELVRLGGNVERGAELVKLSDEPDQIRCWLRSAGGDLHVRSSYLVGCDGPHSTVRRLRHFGYAAGESELVYHVADVEIDWALPASEIVWMVDGPTEVVAVPLPGEKRYRLNLWRSGLSLPGEGSFGALEAPMALAQWRGILERLAPCDVSLNRLRSSLAYRTGHGLADRFANGRTILVGDAAHALPQCTAQGLNLALQGAHNLAWKLALVVHGDAPGELLESYQRERRPVAEAALAAMVREPGMMGRAAHLESREALDRWSGLALDYRHSRDGFCSLGGSTVQAGDRAPDGGLLRAGRTVPLRELMVSPRFHLLAFSDFADDKLARLVTDLREQFEPLIEILEVGPASDALLDKDNRLHRFYAARHGDLILIRPDRFIAARASVLEPNELLEYLAQTLIPPALSAALPELEISSGS